MAGDTEGSDELQHAGDDEAADCPNRFEGHGIKQSKMEWLYSVGEC
jgi:hypothetical protein